MERQKIIHQLKLGGRTLLMGILNVTPDSFYDAGRYFDANKAIERAQELISEGADIIDIGGESTRPGSRPVSLEEELDRVIPVIEGLRDKIDIPISIDTQKAEVARQAIELGVSIVNDVSALCFDDKMADVAAKGDVYVVLMHMKGNPRIMQENPVYNDVIAEIKEFFRERIDFAKRRGIKEENIILDPGIGFGKLLQHNLEIIKRLGEFRGFGRPVLIGPSRKSFIGKILDKNPEERIWGTAAAVTACIMNGADILRVHDVSKMKDVVRVADVLRAGDNRCK